MPENTNPSKKNPVCIYYYLAIDSSLLPGQADEESSGRLCGVTLEELEHVAAGLGDRSHLGDDGQVVDDEAHLVLLVASQRLGVTQQSEAYTQDDLH